LLTIFNSFSNDPEQSLSRREDPSGTPNRLTGYSSQSDHHLGRAPNRSEGGSPEAAEKAIGKRSLQSVVNYLTHFGVGVASTLTAVSLLEKLPWNRPHRESSAPPTTPTTPASSTGSSSQTGQNQYPGPNPNQYYGMFGNQYSGQNPNQYYGQNSNQRRNVDHATIANFFGEPH
jgi:hypothetical protein